MEKAAWTRQPEYELPEVLELRAEIEAVEREARKRVQALQEKIEHQRHERGFLHELLRQQGDPLVEAVITTLKALGFTDVRDVDSDAREAGKAAIKREDIQILDRSPTLLVEVKGIGGLPSEEEALQSGKYVAPRMKEWERFDVQALSIINHQRSLPPLDRQNHTVFQEDVPTNAEQQHIGLMTTFDLFRLARDS